MARKSATKDDLKVDSLFERPVAPAQAPVAASAPVAPLNLGLRVLKPFSTHFRGQHRMHLTGSIIWMVDVDQAFWDDISELIGSKLEVVS